MSVTFEPVLSAHAVLTASINSKSFPLNWTNTEVVAVAAFFVVVAFLAVVAFFVPMLIGFIFKNISSGGTSGGLAGPIDWMNYMFN